MPQFIPEVRAGEIAFDSERLVYEALGGLEPGYVVLHSFPWLRPTRDLAGEPLREGEADFVIVHAEKGLLVVEVKGGDIHLEGRTRWRSDSFPRGGACHGQYAYARRRTCRGVVRR